VAVVEIIQLLMAIQEDLAVAPEVQMTHLDSEVLQQPVRDFLVEMQVKIIQVAAVGLVAPAEQEVTGQTLLEMVELENSPQ
jgi:hypothetical protein